MADTHGAEYSANWKDIWMAASSQPSQSRKSGHSSKSWAPCRSRNIVSLSSLVSQVSLVSHVSLGDLVGLSSQVRLVSLVSLVFLLKLVLLVSLVRLVCPGGFVSHGRLGAREIAATR